MAELRQKPHFTGKTYTDADGWDCEPFSGTTFGGGKEKRDEAMANEKTRAAALAMIQAWVQGQHDAGHQSPKKDLTQLVECAWVFVRKNGSLGMVSEYNYMSMEIHDKISATHAQEGVQSAKKCAEDKLRARNQTLPESVLFSAAVNVHGGSSAQTSKPIPACPKCSVMLKSHGIVDAFHHLT